MTRNSILQRAAALFCALSVTLTSCAVPQPAQESTTTLKLLLRGSAQGLERTLDALYAQMDNNHRWQLEITFLDSADYAQQLARSLTAHEDYDLVFDAPWISLTTQSMQKNYLDLEPFFQDPAYPALQAFFPQEYLDANRIDGRLYAIPFTNTYYDVPGIFYRQDLLEDLSLGFSSISTAEQMRQYWQALSGTDIKAVTLGARGFFLLNLPEITCRQQGIWDIPGWSFWNYPGKVILSQDGTTALDVVFPGDDPSHFSGLAAPYQQDFLLRFFEQNASDAAFLQPDEILRNNGMPAFLQGQSASFEGTLGSIGTNQLQKALQKEFPAAKVAFWPYDEAFTKENQQPGSIPSTYSAWNYLCIPAYSSDPEQAMAFLDWLFNDTKRLDMLNYGVEGIDWQSEGTDGYHLLDTGEAAFQFPSYELAWTPFHHRMDVTLPAEERALWEFLYDSGSYTSSPLTGFQLDTSPIRIEIASLEALYADYYTGLMNGAYGEGTAAVIAELHHKSVDAGLESVRAEILRQVQSHLDSKNP